MIMVWNDAESFRQHLEQMKIFRRSHYINTESRLSPLKNMPTHFPIQSPVNATGARGSIKTRSEATLIPVGEIVPPRNSQN